LHGRKTLEQWAAAAAAGDWDTLVADLLSRHYDPMYTRSIDRNFPRIADAIVVEPAELGADAFRRLARDVEEQVRARSAPVAAVTA
jgi:tRNA 2-selenouridine synthase